MAAVLLVDVLDDFSAPFVFEVDVDVRRFIAFATDESFEQQVDAFGVDGRNAEAITDGGVRGGASPLAEDVSGAGESDEIVDGEEVRGVLERLDQVEFVFDLAVDGIVELIAAVIIASG